MNSEKRVIIFSLAFYPFESGGEIAPRKIMELNPDIHFDVITWKFNTEWQSIETKNNITIYRIAWPTKYGYIVGGFLKAVRLTFKQPYDFSWSIMAGYSGGIALLYKIFFSRTPLLLTLQEGDPIEHIMKRVGILRPLFRLLFEKADAIQAISNYLASFGKQMGFRGMPIVVPNGVEVPVEVRPPNFSEVGPPQEIILISNSRLEKKNGFDIVIRALKVLPENIIFKNVGDGAERENLIKLAKELDVAGRVTLDQAVPYEQAIEYLKQGDIFVRPSRTEGLGSSFLEAMAQGVPIIGTPVGGIPDFLKDGETGIFCEPESPENFAQAVTRLVQNPALYEHVSKGGYELVKSGYSWQSVGMRMRNLFESLHA
ncbi:MAG: glycosyltransferase family 4 protein [Candidatus Paceibacterota bacterium]